MRFGMLLETVRPAVVVFDGTWPFHGFMDACDAYGVPRRVWSNRGLHKAGFEAVPVSETAFDLVLQPGEIGTLMSIDRPATPGRKVTLPPVAVLREDELLEMPKARDSLGLDPNGRYALLSLGPGNLKDIGELAQGVIDELRQRGFDIVWAKAPISVSDITLPGDVLPVSVYPLAQCMRAFDVFVGASGYNTCCEVVQSGVPSLLVPNAHVADDQARRARTIAERGYAVVSTCETRSERSDAIERLIALATERPAIRDGVDLGGARYAADEIVALL
jgi:hypothetical protein